MVLLLSMEASVTCLLLLLLCLKNISCEVSSHATEDPLQEIKQMINDRFDVMNSKQQIVIDRLQNVESKLSKMDDTFRGDAQGFDVMNYKQQIVIDRLHIMDSKLSKMDDTITGDVQGKLMTLEGKVIANGERTSQLEQFIDNALVSSVNEIDVEKTTLLEEIKQLMYQERNLINAAVSNITLRSNEMVTQLDSYKNQSLDEINFQEKSILKEIEVVKEKANLTSNHILNSMDETFNSSVKIINKLVEGLKDVIQNITEEITKLNGVYHPTYDVIQNITEITKLKRDYNSIYDEIENMNEEITKLKVYHQIDMHEVNFLTSGGIARATSHSSTYSPMKAFDGSTFWHTHHAELPQSVWFEFPNPIRIEKYSFKSRDSRDYAHLTVADGPSKYIFWASNDNDCSNESSWAILHVDYSGTPFTTANVPKTKFIDNKNFYRCYGFKVIDVPGRTAGKFVGSKYVAVSNIHFYSG